MGSFLSDTFLKSILSTVNMYILIFKSPCWEIEKKHKIFNGSPTEKGGWKWVRGQVDISVHVGL
jgi:hypothetical protein